MRRSGALTLDMAGIAVTRPRDDGAPVSTEVGVVRFRMRSGSVFLHLRAWWSALKSFGCMHAGSILCWRCTGLARGRFAALSERLAKFKMPKRVLIVDSLPRNTMGKVQKTTLRETYKGIYAVPTASHQMPAESPGADQTCVEVVFGQSPLSGASHPSIGRS
jgi:hypothetical protein